MVLVLVRNQTRVSVTQIGRVSNVQSHSALVFWQTVPLQYAVVEVHVLCLTRVFAKMVIQEQFAKHHFVTASLVIRHLFAMVWVRVHN